jgi:glycosyltransferase involved in cell wall biosynthesis
MKVNIIGPYPPPYGGISVHVKRMKKYLTSMGVEVEVFKDNKRTFFKIPFLQGVIHLHSISLKKRIIMGLFASLFNKKIVLTIHGESLHNQLEESNWIAKKLLLLSMKKISRIICVNSKILEELAASGIAAHKLIYLPAYINPMDDENDFTSIPYKIWDFINDSKFLISANGWITFYKNQDLYGMDMLIELMRRLKKEAYDVSMVIAVLGSHMQNRQERLYYDNLKSKIINHNLQKCIFLYEPEDTEFYPILKKSSLFIRPTNTDGYAVSLAEALYYKVPSIASDVPDRPQGTIIFETRNMEDLYIKTVEVIENYDLYKEKIEDIKMPENEEKLLNIYKGLNH